MKAPKLLLLLLLLFTVSAVHAQDVDTQALIRSINGQWKIDEAGKVVCSKVIAFPGISKEEIYNNALYFLHQEYGNAGIQHQDLEKGEIQVKGIYPRVHTAGGRSNQYYYNALHEVQLDVQDEKMVLKVTLYGYFLTSYNHPYDAEAVDTYFDKSSASHENVINIREIYPAGRHTELVPVSKTDTGQAFYESHQRAWATIYRVGGVLIAAMGEEAE